MQYSRSHGRLLVAALLGSVCFGVGCATSTRRTSKAEEQPVPTTAALTHFATGVSLEARQEMDAAIAEYEKAYELDPANSNLAGRLAHLYLGRKERDKAIAITQKAIKATPHLPGPWFWLGVAHRAGDELPTAIQAFQESLKINPTYLLALRALVEAHFHQNSTDEVPPLLQRAFQQTSDDASYWLGLGDLCVFAFKQKPSLSNQLTARFPRDCFEKAAAIKPHDPEILLRLAEAHMEASDFVPAAEAFAQLLKVRPDLTQLRERLATAYLRADNKEKAVAALKEILKREPLRHDIHNSLAEIHQDLNKDTDAVSHLQQSLLLNPNQLEVYARLALAQMRLKRYTDALQNLTIARTKFPARFQIPYLTGLVYHDMKQYEKAVAALTDAEQLLLASEEDKPTSAFYFMYGSVCERAGQFDRAVGFLRKSLELDPKNHNAANSLGYMWADNNQNLTEALDLINKAVAAQPENPAYLDSLGWVYYRLGRDNDALQQLRRSVELLKEPDDTVLDHLADVLHKLGHHDEAIEYLREAIKVAPENKGYSQKLQKWTK